MSYRSKPLPAVPAQFSPQQAMYWNLLLLNPPGTLIRLDCAVPTKIVNVGGTFSRDVDEYAIIFPRSERIAAPQRQDSQYSKTQNSRKSVMPSANSAAGYSAVPTTNGKFGMPLLDLLDMKGAERLDNAFLPYSTSADVTLSVTIDISGSLFPLNVPLQDHPHGKPRSIAWVWNYIAGSLYAVLRLIQHSAILVKPAMVPPALVAAYPHLRDLQWSIARTPVQYIRILGLAIFEGIWYPILGYAPPRSLHLSPEFSLNPFNLDPNKAEDYNLFKSRVSHSTSNSSGGYQETKALVLSFMDGQTGATSQPAFSKASSQKSSVKKRWC
ncbi:hypothetical protein FA15DRAFT_704419 [Coprinopsis marcescibilis]|uniref:Uncharacterized protein n=1 Tax=Coprinopsis marcescibilis TaxID=230819 RepID=A0A5C3KVG1_COPMA|nr:hypothetical protein FA15DRAFT_704419 [Coprinopsis marcescibilis]